MNARREIEFGAAYLQARIVGEFPLARHLGVAVDVADDECVVLSAPLAPNANFKGTAFGGSLFSVAVLTGWAWVTRHLALRQMDADAVIQDSAMRYLVPVEGGFTASLPSPPPAHVERFERMLRRAGRGRIRLQVDIRHGHTPAARFEGVYAAAVR